MVVKQASRSASATTPLPLQDARPQAETQEGQLRGIAFAFSDGPHTMPGKGNRAVDWAKVQTLFSAAEPGAMRASLCIQPIVAEESDHNQYQNSLCHLGDVWMLQYQNKKVYRRDSKGLRYLTHLIANQGKHLHVTDVFGAGSDADRVLVLGSSGHLLDDEALASYQWRIVELQEELATAEANHDFGRQEVFQRELDCLTHEATSAIALGGRHRERTDADRFRVSVTMAIHRAIASLESTHAELAHHLVTSVQTGHYLAYAPKPWGDWDFD